MAYPETEAPDSAVNRLGRARPQSCPKSRSASALQVSESTTTENRGSTAHKLVFVGNETEKASGGMPAIDCHAHNFSPETLDFVFESVKRRPREVADTFVSVIGSLRSRSDVVKTW